MDQEQKRTLDGFRPISITDYNTECPVDKLFINQELLRVKYAALSTQLKKARSKAQREELTSQIEEIKDLAYENSEKIKKALEDRNKQNALGIDKTRDAQINQMIEDGQLKPKKRR